MQSVKSMRPGPNCPKFVVKEGKWCRGGLKWIWDGFKGIKMAVCCIFNVCSLLIQFYEENWWAVDYGICYNPDVASESGLCSNC
ncbi:hypothetical protein HanRHA438_Chr13g0585271 [Helianthus annuus]|nr:hypothetical protein HanRHA438_Chr13g0585271 [Helianthus annuus]